MKTRNPSRGYSLIECIVYMAALLVILGLAIALLHETFDHYHRLNRNADDIARALYVGERWRDEVRAAQSEPRWETTAAAPEFQIQHTNGLIRYAFHQGSVWRCGPDETHWALLLADVKNGPAWNQPVECTPPTGSGTSS